MNKLKKRFFFKNANNKRQSNYNLIVFLMFKKKTSSIFVSFIELLKYTVREWYSVFGKTNKFL